MAEYFASRDTCAKEADAGGDVIEDFLLLILFEDLVGGGGFGRGVVRSFR